MATLRQRFVAYYMEFHKGICRDCLPISVARLELNEPVWFEHEECATKFNYIRSLFSDAIKVNGEQLHDSLVRS